MTDQLRRLFGLGGGGQRSAKESAGEEETSDAQRRREKAGEPKLELPELVPGTVSILGGRTTITSAALRVTLVVAGVVLALLLAWQLLGLILLVVVALIVAAAMYQPVQALEGRGLPRPLALALSYLGVFGVVVLLAIFIIRPLVSEVEALIENAPELIGDLRDQAVGFIDGLAGEGTGAEIVEALQGALQQLDLGGLLEVPLAVTGGLVDVILVLFLSAFLVLERDRAASWLLPLLSRERREPARTLGASVFQRLGRWVYGQLLIMTVVALAMFGALTVLGVPFVLPLTLFTFLVEAIPFIGPWLAIIPAIAVAFTESPTTALLLGAWWLIVQQLEGYVLTPAVMGKVQHLSGTVVLLSVLAGFELFGILGALIAVPVVAAVAMVVEAVLRPARVQAVEKEPAPGGA
ncbi:MAG TPA: AI-2E family transporter [Candidatus Limnocylindria bacterium]|nr:AI-2E family transporter [Candidatus Limnocylindria bacterium]